MAEILIMSLGTLDKIKPRKSLLNELSWHKVTFVPGKTFKEFFWQRKTDATLLEEQEIFNRYKERIMRNNRNPDDERRQLLRGFINPLLR